MNSLSNAIEQAVQECKETGRGEVEINGCLSIRAEWEEVNGYDMVAVSFVEHYRCILWYYLEETKVKVEEKEE